MPKPLKNKYEDVCYHVMNGEGGWQHIFHGKYFFAKLDTKIKRF